AVHEEVLRRRGVLRDDNILVYGKPVPEQDLWTGAYLDDLLVALRCTVPEPVPLDGTFVPPEPQESDEDVRAIRAAIAGYEEAGLQRAVHKEFNQIVDFKAWGAVVKGVKGTVGAPMEVRQQLWALLAKVVSLGWCTREVLQRIVGYVSFVFQFRREMYSLQHHIYKFMANLPRQKWRRIPGHVLDELRSFALHLPFAYFSMRKRLDLEVLATDATPTSGGAVTALVSEALADELWRKSEVRGEPVRLDRSEGFLSSIAPPAAPSQFASAVAESLPWSVISSYSFRQTSHINLQELRALRREIVRLASRSSGEGQIKLCLNDSRVVIGAVTKGRSSSYKLNGLLRTMLPYLTAANITLALLWVETESNRADAPSRFESLPAPVPAPPWLQSFGVDAWRAGAGLEVFSRAGRMTEAHRALGLPMLEPIDFTLGRDVFDSDIEARLRRREVAWLWLAPPSKGFNRRWCAQAGPAIRPKGEPEGDEADPRTWWGNLLWRHSLYLAQVALDHGVFVFLEHPRKSLAWALRDTELFQHRAGMIKHRVDWCMYGEHGHDLSVGNAQSVVLSNAPWLGSVIRRCAQKHVHPIPVRGSSAKRCDHPWGFCVELANAYRSWKEASSEYRRGLREAGAWLLSMALALGAPLRRSSSPGLVDRWLERCVDHAYRTGEKLYRVRLGVLGVQRILNIAGPLLRSTWSALRGWRALQPVRSRVPISSSLLHAFLVVSLARGNAEVGRARERWWSAMLAAWLSFEGLLRPGELCQLRAGDIDLPLDSLTAADEGLILTIRQPKTRRVYHTQFVLVKEPRLVKWMVWWLDAVPSGRKLFRLGRREWARLLTAGLSALGADQNGYTLGSLRGGGATAHFRAHENLARLQYHGRWARSETLRFYLHEAWAAQGDAQLSASSKERRLQRALRELADALQEAEQEEQQKESRASQPGRGSASSRATSPAPSLAGSSSSWSRVGGAKARAAATERDPLRRRAIVHLSRPTPSRRLSGGRHGPVEFRSSEPSLPTAQAVDVTASTLLQAAQSAAQSLGEHEVDQGLTPAEILQDQHSRDSASRWRAGDARRRITAALARLVNSLQSWTTGSTERASTRNGPQPVRPRPVQALRVDPSTAAASSMWWPRYSWINKWTLLGLMLMVLFPKVTALVFGLMVRLVLRALSALISHLARELFTQILEITGDIEAQLVHFLSVQLGLTSDWHPPMTMPGAPAPPVYPAFAPPPAPPAALPARPMDMITLVLVALQLRNAPGLGWGGGQC
ncbi:unnamed protein product, partial [Symbiodinium sp. CCMP2592]